MATGCVRTQLTSDSIAASFVRCQCRQDGNEFEKKCVSPGLCLLCNVRYASRPHRESSMVLSIWREKAFCLALLAASRPRFTLCNFHIWDPESARIFASEIRPVTFCTSPGLDHWEQVPPGDERDLAALIKRGLGRCDGSRVQDGQERPAAGRGSLHTPARRELRGRREGGHAAVSAANSRVVWDPGLPFKSNSLSTPQIAPKPKGAFRSCYFRKYMRSKSVKMR